MVWYRCSGDRIHRSHAEASLCVHSSFNQNFASLNLLSPRKRARRSRRVVEDSDDELDIIDVQAAPGYDPDELDEVAVPATPPLGPSLCRAGVNAGASLVTQLLGSAFSTPTSRNPSRTMSSNLQAQDQPLGDEALTQATTVSEDHTLHARPSIETTSNPSGIFDYSDENNHNDNEAPSHSDTDPNIANVRRHASTLTSPTRRNTLSPAPSSPASTILVPETPLRLRPPPVQNQYTTALQAQNLALRADRTRLIGDLRESTALVHRLRVRNTIQRMNKEIGEAEKALGAGETGAVATEKVGLRGGKGAFGELAQVVFYLVMVAVLVLAVVVWARRVEVQYVARRLGEKYEL